VVIPSYGMRLDGIVTAVGHQGLSTASQSSMDMESALNNVPIKVQLSDAPAELPPGIRARILIRNEMDHFAWLRPEKLAGIWPFALLSRSEQ